MSGPLDVTAALRGVAAAFLGVLIDFEAFATPSTLTTALVAFTLVDSAVSVSSFGAARFLAPGVRPAFLVRPPEDEEDAEDELIRGALLRPFGAVRVLLSDLLLLLLVGTVVPLVTCCFARVLGLFVGSSVNGSCTRPWESRTFLGLRTVDDAVFLGLLFAAVERPRLERPLDDERRLDDRLRLRLRFFRAAIRFRCLTLDGVLLLELLVRPDLATFRRRGDAGTASVVTASPALLCPGTADGTSAFTESS